MNIIKMNITQSIRKLKTLSLNFQMFFFLNNNTLELDALPNIRILGTTLWIDYNEQIQSMIEASINDFKHIHIIDKNNINNNNNNDNNNDCHSHEEKETRLFTVQDCNKIYQDNLKWLKKELNQAKNDGKYVIILSHHAPMDYLCVDPLNKEDPVSLSLEYSNLEYLFEPPLIGWFFGHTHYNCDYFVKLNKKKDFNMKLFDNKFENGYDDDDNYWFIRIATNQQGYLPTNELAKGLEYTESKVICFPHKYQGNQDVDCIELDLLKKSVTKKQEYVDNFVRKSKIHKKKNKNKCHFQCSYVL